MQKVRKGHFLDALQGENKKSPPVWFMRQAGRYLPSYRALRAKYSLLDLFLTPELAAEITLMPVKQLGVDAAILFSDISLVALGLGLRLEFSEGPKIDPLLSPEMVPCLPLLIERLSPVIEAVQLLEKRLEVPLIGFCGGPFTVASYLVKGGIEGLKKWVYQYPEALDALLEKITACSIALLKAQVEAGADAIQIFDSWASVLSREAFQRFCLPYYRQLLAAVDVPAILFSRNLSLYLEDVVDLPCALSIDWQTALRTVRSKTKQPLQGNLDPDLLYAPLSVIEKKGKELIASMKGDPAFIAGLGHGVKPDVTVEAVQCLVKALQ